MSRADSMEEFGIVSGDIRLSVSMTTLEGRCSVKLTPSSHGADLPGTAHSSKLECSEYVSMLLDLE